MPTPMPSKLTPVAAGAEVARPITVCGGEVPSRVGALAGRVGWTGSLWLSSRSSRCGGGMGGMARSGGVRTGLTVATGGGPAYGASTNWAFGGRLPSGVAVCCAGSLSCSRRHRVLAQCMARGMLPLCRFAYSRPGSLLADLACATTAFVMAPRHSGRSGTRGAADAAVANAKMVMRKKAPRCGVRTRDAIEWAPGPLGRRHDPLVPQFLQLPYGVGFAELLDVAQYAEVNAVNDGVGPQTPVTGGPEGVSVPSGAGEARPVAVERREGELPAGRDEKSLQVRRVDRSVRRPLGQGRRIAGHAETKEARLVPHSDRLDERARRKFAEPGCIDDARPQRIRNAGAEIPLGLIRNGRERNDVLTDAIDRRVDDDGRVDSINRRGSTERTFADDRERQKRRDEVRRRRRRPRHARATIGAEQCDDERERKCHGQADDAFPRQREQKAAQEQQREGGDEIRPRRRAVTAPLNERRQIADAERHGDKEPGAIREDDARGEGNGDRRHGQGQNDGEERALQCPAQIPRALHGPSRQQTKNREENDIENGHKKERRPPRAAPGISEPQQRHRHSEPKKRNGDAQQRKKQPGRDPLRIAVESNQPPVTQRRPRRVKDKRRDREIDRIFDREPENPRGGINTATDRSFEPPELTKRGHSSHWSFPRTMNSRSKSNALCVANHLNSFRSTGQNSLRCSCASVLATAMCTVPTGLASEPPPGPAMPVMPTPYVVPKRSRMPRASAIATSSETSPCSAISAGATLAKSCFAFAVYTTAPPMKKAEVPATSVRRDASSPPVHDSAVATLAPRSVSIRPSTASSESSSKP